jgi:hypothetical protein
MNFQSIAQRTETKYGLWADSCNKFFLNHQETWKSVPYLVAIALLFNFSSLAFYSISIDSEMAVFREDAQAWLSQGRWTAYIIERFIFPKTTIPFLPTALFCLSAAVSYVYVLISHNLKTTSLTYLAFPLFCAFPVWRVLGEFPANLPSASLGLLACSIAAYIFKRVILDEVVDKNVSSFSKRVINGVVLQAILIAMAVGGYQSYAIAFVCFGLGMITLKMMTDQDFDFHRALKSVTALAIILILGLLFYSIIQFAFLYVLDLKILYIQNFNNPERLLGNPIKVIGNFFAQAVKIYIAPPSVFGSPLTSSIVLIFFGFLTITYRQFPTHKNARILLKVLAAVCLFAPFSLSLLAGSGIPLRAIVAAPYVIWLFTIIALGNRSRLLKMLSILAVCVGIFQILYISSKAAANRQLTQQHDVMLATSIYERIISAHPDFDPNKTYKIDLFGRAPVHKIFSSGKGSTATGSFFEWDGGNVHRMIYFMHLIGYSNIEYLDKDKRLELIPQYDDMPVWPAQGSVKVVDDITLIKLGETKGYY